MTQTLPGAHLKNFEGLTIVSFESRMQEAMTKGVTNLGGKILSAPSLQEIPLENNPEAFRFGEKLLAGQIDLVIFMTGVGIRYLIEILTRRLDKAEIVKALGRVTTVARGPKPVAALRELAIVPTMMIPEPNTWAEILEELDSNAKGVELEGRTVAIQEYGVASEELVRGLKKRGANVIQVPVYRWALPEDVRPIESAIQEILAAKAHVAFFTNAQQIRHVLRVASAKGLEADLRKAFKKVVIASIGPVCTEALREEGVVVDFEPSHPKLGILIKETAEQIQTLMEEKTSEAPLVKLVSRTVSASDLEKRCQSPFLKACRREPVPYTPVWLMRQAGRYMKEYQKIRSRVSFKELCQNPELCAQVTIHAQEKIKADAAIIFSDILLVVESLGLGLNYSKDDGPVIDGFVTDLKAIENLPEIEPEESLGYVFDAIRITRASLKNEIPLIGFSGAPFTLAAYMIEGGASKAFVKTKKFMQAAPEAWHALMQKISRGLVKYLTAQAEAGADCLQLFDSWVGCLGPKDYREFVMPHTQAVIWGLKAKVPVIHFGTGTGTFMKEMREAGGDVIGADFRIGLDTAWKEIGYDVAIQGNLDPAVLFAPLETIKKSAQKILDQAAGRPGHIFNLGHGILPGTPVDHVISLIDFVHELSAKGACPPLKSQKVPPQRGAGPF